MWGLEIVERGGRRRDRQRARATRSTNARFFAGDVRLALRELVEKAGRPDVVVVDPPRAGLSQKVVRRIIEAAPKRIVYVSCNPTTLAPNAAQLAEAGYELARVRPVDMFPQTPHIECVALLERGRLGSDEHDRLDQVLGGALGAYDVVAGRDLHRAEHGVAARRRPGTRPATVCAEVPRCLSSRGGAAGRRRDRQLEVGGRVEVDGRASPPPAAWTDSW